MYTIEQVAKTIDHSVLKPNYTDGELKQHAALAIKYGVCSMCVKPCDIKAAANYLKDSGVKVSCVLSFPHGADTTATKAFQAQQAVSDGADEIDMVMNIGKFLSGEFGYVVNDIKAVVEVARQNGIIVKVIQESGFLTMEQVAKACELSYEAGADFVKTSTGFGPGSATPENIEVMIKTVGSRMKVKASGGIRDWASAVAFLEQGADRLGIGSTEAVLSGGVVNGSY